MLYYVLDMRHLRYLNMRRCCPDLLRSTGQLDTLRDACQQIASKDWYGDREARNVQGSKALVVGDARAFLSMYQALAAAGLRAVQLDRVLQSASADAAAICEACP